MGLFSILSYYLGKIGGSSKEEKLIEVRAQFVCDNLQMPHDLKDLYFMKILPNCKDFYIDKIKENEGELDGWMYLFIANWMADMVESGQYHTYRGVLSMQGKTYMDIFLNATRYAVKYKVLDQETADKNISTVRKNVSQAG